MTDYLGLHPSYVDTTEAGGASYMVYVGHAASAIAAGKCQVVLITLAEARDRSWAAASVSGPMRPIFEDLYGISTPTTYALAARRACYEFGTTSEQLAMVKVTASQHAQYNPNAFLRKPTTVEQVLASPMDHVPCIGTTAA